MKSNLETKFNEKKASASADGISPKVRHMTTKATIRAK